MDDFLHSGATLARMLAKVEGLASVKWLVLYSHRYKPRDKSTEYITDSRDFIVRASTIAPFCRLFTIERT